MSAEEERLFTKHFARPQADKPLGASHIGDQSTWIGSLLNLGKKIKNRSDRSGQDDEIGAANRLARIGKTFIDHSRGERPRENFRLVAPDAPRRTSPRPERQRPRAANQPETDDRDALEVCVHKKRIQNSETRMEIENRNPKFGNRQRDLFWDSKIQNRKSSILQPPAPST
jgi:hypothetical protein